MEYSNYKYIASCVFTLRYPQLSGRIQEFLLNHFRGICIMRCCTEKYKVREYEEKMTGKYQDAWCRLPHFLPEAENEVVVAICHNCTNIYRAQHPHARVISLWELLLMDDRLQLPDFKGEKMTVQDCWRSNHNTAEQDAVRKLMNDMNISIVELEDNREKTRFCGYTLLQPQPPRNAIICPAKYRDEADAQRLFQPHTDEEKLEILANYCKRYTTERVVTYCHYCTDGIRMASKPVSHLAEMIFK